MKLQVENFGPGDVIVKQGDQGDAFYIVREGNLEVLVRKERSQRRVRTLAAGDFFGEIALLRDVPRTATVQALDAGSVWRLERPARLVEGDQVVVTVKSDNIGCIRLALSPFGDEDPRRIEASPDLLQALETEPGARTRDQADRAATKAFFWWMGGIDIKQGRLALYGHYILTSAAANFLIQGTTHTFQGGVRYSFGSAKEGVTDRQ